MAKLQLLLSRIGTSPKFDHVSEGDLCDMYAAGRQEQSGSAVCREATSFAGNRWGYRIDLLERKPDEHLITYEFKKVGRPADLRTLLYQAIGQITVYSTVIPQAHQKVVFLITREDYSTEVASLHLSHIKQRLGIKVFVCPFDTFTRECTTWVAPLVVAPSLQEEYVTPLFR